MRRHWCKWRKQLGESTNPTSTTAYIRIEPVLLKLSGNSTNCYVTVLPQVLYNFAFFIFYEWKLKLIWWDYNCPQPTSLTPCPSMDTLGCFSIAPSPKFSYFYQLTSPLISLVLKQDEVPSWHQRSQSGDEQPLQVPRRKYHQNLFWTTTAEKAHQHFNFFWRRRKFSMSQMTLTDFCRFTVASWCTMTWSDNSSSRDHKKLQNCGCHRVLHRD